MRSFEVLGVSGALLFFSGCPALFVVDRFHSGVAFVSALAAAVLGFIGLLLGGEEAKRRWYQKHGVPARAEIVTFRDTRQRIENPTIEFDLKVSPVTGGSYVVKLKLDGIPPLELAKLAGGRVLAAWVDPSRPDDVVVSWDAEPPDLLGGYRR